MPEERSRNEGLLRQPLPHRLSVGRVERVDFVLANMRNRKENSDQRKSSFTGQLSNQIEVRLFGCCQTLPKNSEIQGPKMSNTSKTFKPLLTPAKPSIMHQLWGKVA